jgi:hypothetical protein
VTRTAVRPQARPQVRPGPPESARPPGRFRERLVFAGAVSAIVLALMVAFLIGRLTAIPALPGGQQPGGQQQPGQQPGGQLPPGMELPPGFEFPPGMQPPADPG